MYVAVHLIVVLAAVATENDACGVKREVYHGVDPLHQVAHALVAGGNLRKLLNETAARYYRISARILIHKKHERRRAHTLCRRGTLVPLCVRAVRT